MSLNAILLCLGSGNSNLKFIVKCSLRMTFHSLPSSSLLKSDFSCTESCSPVGSSLGASFLWIEQTWIPPCWDHAFLHSVLTAMHLTHLACDSCFVIINERLNIFFSILYSLKKVCCGVKSNTVWKFPTADPKPAFPNSNTYIVSWYMWEVKQTTYLAFAFIFLMYKLWIMPYICWLSRLFL